MGRRGRKRPLEVEAEYWQLLKAGVGTVAACRMVGSPARPATDGGPRTVGSHRCGWPRRARAGTCRCWSASGSRPCAAAASACGRSPDAFGRSPSTVSRELRRNLRPHDQHIYDGDLAHARARQPRLHRDHELRELVQAKLELEWSPQQIAAYLRVAYPDRPDWHLCHETIYQALYHDGKGGLSRQLTRRLRTGRPLRKRRRRADQRRIRFVAPALLLDHRPATVEQRVRVGDWEGDLLVGRMSQSAIGTLVDRTSRYLKLVHLPDGHSAEQLWLALTEVMVRVPQQARLTLTWDQGSEMACHNRVAEHFAEGIYFAHSASPWQRGTNENTNGLLRQYFPKQTDLGVHTLADLLAVEERLNHRPRRVLGWQTPAQVFHAAVT
jgi:transposase, IS30 family